MRKKILLIITIVIASLMILTYIKSTHRATSKPLYVALGDSVAAGAGLNPFPTNSCNQSTEAYSNVLAISYNLNLVTVACAGATIPAGILRPQNSYSPQLQKLFSAGTPKYASITIGGNDISWYNAMVLCYQTQCTSSSLPSSLVASESTLLVNLQEVLKTISNHYGNAVPEFIVTGYYNLVNPNYDCSDLKGANSKILASSSKTIVTSLNNTLQQAIKPYSFATFVPVDFSGHELCSPIPWIQGLSDRAPYHPNKAGQQAYANAIYSTAIVKH